MEGGGRKGGREGRWEGMKYSANDLIMGHNNKKETRHR